MLLLILVLSCQPFSHPNSSSSTAPTSRSFSLTLPARGSPYRAAVAHDRILLESLEFVGGRVCLKMGVLTRMFFGLLSSFPFLLSYFFFLLCSFFFVLCPFFCPISSFFLLFSFFSLLSLYFNFVLSLLRHILSCHSLLSILTIVIIPYF